MDNIPNDEELVRVLAEEGMDGAAWWSVVNARASTRDPEYPGQYRTWNPLTDADDMLMLIKAMKKKEWWVDIENHTKWHVEFLLCNKVGVMFQADNDDFKRAVSNAAFLTLKKGL